jgi:hypothetical protein
MLDRQDAELTLQHEDDAAHELVRRAVIAAPYFE